MNATKKDVEGFNFIFDEAMRLSDLFNESTDKYCKEFEGKLGFPRWIDAPREILEKKAFGECFQIKISPDSVNRMFQIAKRQIKSNKLEYEVTESEFVQEIKNSIYIHVENNKNYNAVGYSKLLSRALKRVQRRMVEVKYYFPFQSGGIKNPIDLGGVKIIEKKYVIDKVEKTTRKEVFLRDKKNDFDSFVCIKVPKCSPKVSLKKAENVANFIYGVICVFAKFNNNDIRQVQLVKNLVRSNATNYIGQKGSDYTVCGEYQYYNDLEEFWTSFNDFISTDLKEIIKELVEYSITPLAENTLADRIIDSFYWYGDASLDQNSQSQVVKLTTSMERLVTLSIEKKDKNLTNRFCKRVSCIISMFHGDLSNWENEALKIYQLRSNLVHGTQSLFKTYEVPLDSDPFRVACFTILSICIFLKKHMALDQIKYEKELQHYFNELLSHCEDNREKLMDKLY